VALDVKHVTLGDLSAAGAVPAEATAIFVTGAIETGWGHARSDRDVFVIAENLDPVAPTDWLFRGVDGEPVGSLIHYAPEGYRLDVEYWRESQIDHAIRRVHERPLDGERSIGLNLTEDDLDVLHDLLIGRALIGEEWLLARQNDLKRARFELLVASRRFSQADSSIEDALGLLESGDEASAVLAATLAFNYVVDGLVAAQGELSPNPKWRARKMLRATPPGLTWDEYWSVETKAGLDPADPEEWTRAVIARCQELMLAVDFQ
jgi:hypothetical protein